MSAHVVVADLPDDSAHPFPRGHERHGLPSRRPGLPGLQEPHRPLRLCEDAILPVLATLVQENVQNPDVGAVEHKGLDTPPAGNIVQRGALGSVQHVLVETGQVAAKT